MALLPQPHGSGRVHHTVFVLFGGGHGRPLGGLQGYGSIDGLLPDLRFDRTLNRRVPLEHFVLLGAGMDAHTLVQGSERAELGSIVRLVGRRLDD